MSQKNKKGVRYIAQSLVKYFGKKYPKYTMALPKARELNKAFTKQKKKVGTKAIFEAMRKKRGTAGAPALPTKLAEPQYYFFLSDYPMYITRCSNKLFFKSKLWKKSLGLIQGGSTPDYGTYFAPYVNYINGLSQNYSPDDNPYDHEWLVKCTQPVFNKNKKRWESEVISVDSNGDRAVYGFDPENIDFNAPAPQKQEKLPQQPKKAPKTPEKPAPTPPPATSDIQAQEKILIAQASKTKAEAEKLRQENIANLLKLFGQGLISKAEFKEQMNIIK